MAALLDSAKSSARELLGRGMQIALVCPTNYYENSRPDLPTRNDFSLKPAWFYPVCGEITAPELAG
jgi:hypothetical protein